MLKCIAVDDEKLALELLEDNIRQVPFLQLVGSCRNAFEALEVLQREPVDLVFLDIQMPGLTGVQFLQTLAYRPMVILVTAYSQYALEGYDLDVVDYLLKPVPMERFVKACNKALELQRLRAQGQSLPDHFFVNADYSLVKIVPAQILFIEGLRDYLKIHYLNGKHLLVRMSLKAIEEKLPPRQFVRVHKSYIISVAQITSVKKNALFLGSQEIPVSDPYREALFALIQPPS